MAPGVVFEAIVRALPPVVGTPSGGGEGGTPPVSKLVEVSPEGGPAVTVVPVEEVRLRVPVPIVVVVEVEPLPVEITVVVVLPKPPEGGGITRASGVVEGVVVVDGVRRAVVVKTGTVEPGDEVTLPDAELVEVVEPNEGEVTKGTVPEDKPEEEEVTEDPPLDRIPLRPDPENEGKLERVGLRFPFGRLAGAARASVFPWAALAKEPSEGIAAFSILPELFERALPSIRNGEVGLSASGKEGLTVDLKREKGEFETRTVFC
jgi:hypothetical protein